VHIADRDDAEERDEDSDAEEDIGRFYTQRCRGGRGDHADRR